MQLRYIIFFIVLLFSTNSLQSASSDTVYTVVVASMKNTTNAKKLAEKLEKFGLKVQILKMDTKIGEMNRICIDKALIRKDAKKIQGNINSTISKNSGWILKVNNYNDIILNSSDVNHTKFGEKELVKTKNILAQKTKSIKIQNIDKVSKQNISTNKTYTVIVSSLKDKNNAIKFSKVLQQKGFDVQVFKMKTKIGDMHRVAVGKAKDRKDAREIQSKLKKNKLNKGWILPIDNYESLTIKNADLNKENELTKDIVEADIEKNKVGKTGEKIIKKKTLIKTELAEKLEPKEEVMKKEVKKKEVKKNNIKISGGNVTINSDKDIPTDVLKSIKQDIINQKKERREKELAKVESMNDNKTISISGGDIASIDKDTKKKIEKIIDTISIDKKRKIEYSSSDTIANTKMTYKIFIKKIKELCFALENYDSEKAKIINSFIDNIYGTYILYHQQNTFRSAMVKNAKDIYNNPAVHSKMNDFYRELYKVRKSKAKVRKLPSFNCELNITPGNSLYVSELLGNTDFILEVMKSVDVAKSKLSDEEREKFLVSGISINVGVKIGGAKFVKAMYFSIEHDKVFLRGLDLSDKCLQNKQITQEK